MKKIYLLLILILLLTGCSSNKEEEKESKREYNTLSEYIKYHDSEHLRCMGAGCNNLEFFIKDFKCDDIKNKEIVYMNYNSMVTSDNTIYDILLEQDKLYSNDQQCKIVDIDIPIDDIYTTSSDIVIKSNDKYYTYLIEERNIRLKEITNNWGNYYVYNEGYKFIGYYNNDMLALKDGDIHLIKVDLPSKKIVSDTIFLSKEKYGNVINVRLSDYLTTKRNDINIENQIVRLITDKVIYMLREKITDECTKYEDIECELELFQSNIYTKYKDDIRYIGLDITLLKDNNIIYTDTFNNELDNK